MTRTLALTLAAAGMLALTGCGGEKPKDTASKGKGAEEKLPPWSAGEAKDKSGDTATPAVKPAAGPVRAGDAKSVTFAVAWVTDEDPATAAKLAARDALVGLGHPVKGLIFYEYFPKKVKDAEGKEEEVPDAEKDRLVLPALREVAGDIPVIGCRARSLVNGGTMLSNTVACLAIGGEAVSCKAVGAKLEDDRKAVGTAVGEALADVKDLKMVMALSEMSLSFETKPGVSVEDFIRGILDTAGKDVTLFGGNCMPNHYPDDKGGIQFLDDEVLQGHVVAMGIGGPIAVHANHTNEFVPSDETVTVTKSEDKLVYELDGKPAPEVYRQLRGMKPEEEFTSDWQHPIGVIVTPDKVYLRMVLAEHKDKKALEFVANIPEGTKVKILKGGDDPKKILDAAEEGIRESLQKAGDAKPLLALLSDCCARGGRLRTFRKADECEVREAILPVMEKKGVFPLFGFYAWGELGPIAGPFGGLSCTYQQHTFVSAVVTEEK